ncbi:MAG TPA: CHRD domain-containing protein [Chloroflexota bacterium]|nr:CHRD domain-containing protein [Chloroflexota bacterium]
MKRFIAGTLALIFTGAISLGGVQVTHGAKSPASMMTSDYSGTLLAPLNMMHKVAGAIAIMPGTSGTMNVAVTVAGLEPNTTHAEHIHTGNSCSSNGPIKYPLPMLHANAAGDASATGTIPISTAPTKGFYVNIHDTNGTPIACGTLHHPSMLVAVKPMGSMVSATAMITAPAPVMGNKSRMGTEVIAVAMGLKPMTAYPFHIHAAPCGTPSPIMYSLDDLVGDAHGNAISGTGITDIIPMAGLSIHVHDTSFKMIACGNIGTGTASSM